VFDPKSYKGRQRQIHTQHGSPDCASTPCKASNQNHPQALVGSKMQCSLHAGLKSPLRVHSKRSWRAHLPPRVIEQLKAHFPAQRLRCTCGLISRQQQQQYSHHLPQAAAQEAATFDELQHSDYPTSVYLNASHLPQEFIGPITIRDFPGKVLVYLHKHRPCHVYKFGRPGSNRSHHISVQIIPLSQTCSI
jgi:hypothetical protein